jgi:hypothetical protein
MTDENPTPSPPRLLSLSPTMASLFTDAESEYREGLDEAHAWQRLRARLADSDQGVARPRQTRLWLAAAVAAGFLLGWFGLRTVQPGPVASVATMSSVEPEANRDTADISIRLAAGRSKLPDGTEVSLDDGAAGTFRSEKLRSTLDFEHGRLEIAVAHQTAERPFVVKAHAFEFVVLGTKFSVKVAGSRVDLDVTEGRVAVHDATRRLKVVEVGGHWSNLDEMQGLETPVPSAVRPAPPEPSAKEPSAKEPSAKEPSAKTSSPATEVAAPSDPSICRDLARTGKSKQAEQCYVAVASGNGLSAEMALYEVARLRRDVLGSPATSLTALDEYESRFASGTLLPEVRMARVDLLARLGRVDEALHASDQLLGSPSGRARTVELHLLRGNLLRDKKHDCTAAIAEYRQIESDPGPRGDQAQYAHARCLEQLGRDAAATEAYRSYLGRPKPQQAERARERLRELAP